MDSAEGADVRVEAAREDHGEAMLWLTRRKLQKLIDTEQVERTITAVELRTSAEIRVSITPWFWGSIDQAADRAFVRLGMTKTRERNGVLFFVVPSRRTFVVLGDGGIHARAGQAFWSKVASTLEDHFRRGEFTEGLVSGIVMAGEQLAAHFPYDPERDVNELPDEVQIGRRL